MPIRRIVVALVATVALALSACAPDTPQEGVSAGDGPAAEQSEQSEQSEPTDGAAHGDTTDAPMDEEPAEEEPTEEPEPAVATFDQKYTYEDGVQVEVIKIKKGKVTRKDKADYADDKIGTPYVQFQVRIKNGSKTRLKEVTSDFTVTYGPDGEEAEANYVPSTEDSDTYLDGAILPGKSKVAGETFAIPTRYQGDVVLEFSFDYEHEAAIFTGSVK